MFAGTVTGVTSLIDVVNSLFDPRHRPVRGRTMQRLGDGIVHVDYPGTTTSIWSRSSKSPVACCHSSSRSPSARRRECRSS
jgi:hypothetical protein